MKLVTDTFNFKSGGLHEKHVVAAQESWEPSQHSLIDAGKPSDRGTLYEDQFTFLIVFRSVPLKMKNVSRKVVEKIKTHFFVWCNFFFRKSYRL
jgi:hypothetical protein